MPHVKRGTRKYLAAALAVAGVAGLSLAAAATLNVTTSKEIAIGSGTFAPCDADGVNVSYDYAKSGANFIINEVTISGIDTACNGEAIAFSLGDATGAELVATSGTVGGASFTYNAASAAISIATDLGDATVIISG